MKRRDFLRKGSKSILAAAGASSLLGISDLLAQSKQPDVVWVENGEPAELVQAALAELGGISSFISNGDVVVVKPNIGWDRAPQFAATTNPDLVQEIIKQCFNAGAKTVKIFDHTCNNPRRCYRSSLIEKKAKAVGANVLHIRKGKFKNISIKDGELIKEWPIYSEYLEADKIINVPIAKHHSLCHVTLGLKNLMGVMGGNRGSIHTNFDRKIIDIDRQILPHLTIIDAYRILTRNGPIGGNLADVKLKKSIIASSCTVSADFIALNLFSHKLEEVKHLNNAVSAGLNRFDLKNLNLKKVQLI